VTQTTKLNRYDFRALGGKGNLSSRCLFGEERAGCAAQSSNPELGTSSSSPNRSLPIWSRPELSDVSIKLTAGRRLNCGPCPPQMPPPPIGRKSWALPRFPPARAPPSPIMGANNSLLAGESSQRKRWQQ